MNGSALQITGKHVRILLEKKASAETISFGNQSILEKKTIKGIYFVSSGTYQIEDGRTVTFFPDAGLFIQNTANETIYDGIPLQWLAINNLGSVPAMVLEPKGLMVDWSKSFIKLKNPSGTVDTLIAVHVIYE
jgi:hypothetical protein